MRVRFSLSAPLLTSEPCSKGACLLLMGSVLADSEQPSKVGQPTDEKQTAKEQKPTADKQPQPFAITVSVPPETPERVAEERAKYEEQTKLQLEAIDTNKKLARYTLAAFAKQTS